MAEELRTEVWFRNPELYVRELVELRVGDLVWDMGYLVKKKIDPQKWIDLYYPQDIPFTMLVVGDTNQGTLELRKGDTLAKPFARHETWQYGDEWAILEAMMENPGGDSEPRVVVTDLPSMGTSIGRAFLRRLKDLQGEFPDVKLHIHGLYAWKLMFALPFASVDIDPRTDAKKGKIMLPTGKDVEFENAGHFQYWVNLLGFRTTDLPVPRNRCMFNIRSAQWAGNHYRTNIKMKSKGDVVVDPDAAFHRPATTAAIRTSSDKPPQEGDKFLCDTCSLQDTCKYYRAGSVCSVPDSEPAPLHRYFKTRDAETIIEGLGTVMATQAQRLNEGRQAEQDFGELDPEVTKIVNSLMTQGIKLAKLLDPRLAAAGAPRVGVQVNVGSGQPAQQLMAQIVAELEAQGYQRDQITPELINRVLENANGDPKRRAIEVAAIDRDG